MTFMTFTYFYVYILEHRTKSPIHKKSIFYLVCGYVLQIPSNTKRKFISFLTIGLLRNHGKNQQKNLSQSIVKKKNNITTLSQPIPNREKQIVNKTRIIKNVFDNQGKHFSRIMNKTKDLLSKIFGYQLIELEGNKYMLVNEIKNELPHIYPCATESSQQVLLFIVLTHIFMQEESCTEESLWDFLTNLDISYLDNHYHPYFGNVKYLINELFVAQKYLDKTILEQNDSIKIEFKWGPRAEYEFSRREALNFVSEIYNRRPLNSWPLQFKILLAREKLNKSH
ncbi:non-structural maintenance of chromosomes element 3 homolog isoform X3 [Apis laboriosa]|uniref:non-structural maintenance of chromosomes element 3 homolog isoform X3 n=1 Tax=Apis laboriosa TaxID=183418 RepID=UPI001CC7F65A|nr:non-structural maintenance of chromosomes element 3 homolog isoform X3 [Apis laboriosa]